MKTQDRIKQLKEEGFRVRIRHERPVIAKNVISRPQEYGLMTKAELENFRTGYPDARFDDKGGCTTVTLLGCGDEVFARAHAYCRPDDEHGPGDQFDRKLGTTIALGRAVKQLEERVNGS